MMGRGDCKDGIRTFGKDGNAKERTSLSTGTLIIMLLSSLGALLTGYSLAILSGSMILLKNEFNLDDLWHMSIVSTSVGSAAISAISGGYLSDVLLGRRPVIMISSALFVTGSVILACSSVKEMLLVGQVFIGIGAGLTTSTSPPYMAEMSPSFARGRLVTLHGTTFALGAAVAGIVAGVFSCHSWGWRSMFGISAIPAISQFFGFSYLPESPRWLFKNGQKDKAWQVLERVHGADVAIDEYEDIHTAETEQRLLEKDSKDGSLAIRVLRTKATRNALFVGCGLQFIQQFAGINTVIYFNSTIIRMSGVQKDTATLWLSGAVMMCSAIGNIVSLCLVDRLGRKLLLLLSLTGVTTGLLITFLAFLLVSLTTLPVTMKTSDSGSCSSYSSCSDCILDENCGFCYLEADGSVFRDTGACLPIEGVAYPNGENCSKMETNDTGRMTLNSTFQAIWSIEFCPSNFGKLTLFGMMIYLLFFELGLGPMTWLINTEIYPTWARGFCSGCATATNWMSNLVVVMTFLHLTRAISRYGTFLLYAAMSSIGFIFVALLLPETKGKTLEETTKIFDEPLCICCNDGHRRMRTGYLYNYKKLNR